MWAKFASGEVRNAVVAGFAKARVSHGQKAKWINEDRPIEKRYQFSVLYGVKKFLTEWQLPMESLWVSEEDFALTWNDELVVSTSVVNKALHVKLGPAWQEYLSIFIKFMPRVIQPCRIAACALKGEGGRQRKIQVFDSSHQKIID